MSRRGPVELFAPGSPEYLAATSPANTVARQRPAFVCRPLDAPGVAAAVLEAAARGLTVVPQATGHGAGAPVGPESLILDTTGLDAVEIDPDLRLARAGAGATWGEVNALAWSHGLLGLAGSAPTVSVAGYTFGGGLGWLAASHGMASAGLRRVEYVTASGEIRAAADDAPDPLDRRAMWAFRGGGGAGIATALEFELVPVPDLWAGYLLWELAALNEVVAAWRGAIAAASGIATSLSVLHLPAAPMFPEHLRDRPVVHLALASSNGPDAARALLDGVRRAAAPSVDTWGPSDATRLSGIHLDPPAAVPALGFGRWLNSGAPDVAAAALRVAAAGRSPLVLVELRNVAGPAASVSGALVHSPAPFLLHAVGPLRPNARPAVEAAFDRLRDVVASADTGRPAGAWMDGAAAVPGALEPRVRLEVAAIADAVDPDGVLFRSRAVVEPPTGDGAGGRVAATRMENPRDGF